MLEEIYKCKLEEKKPFLKIAINKLEWAGIVVQQYFSLMLKKTLKNNLKILYFLALAI